MEQTHEVWSVPVCIPGILVTRAFAWNIPCIWTVYTMHMLKRLRYTTYIPWLFMIIYGINFMVYTLYIHKLGIYIGYVLNIPCLYMVYTVYIHSIIHVYSPPGGWCCGGGLGPIPPTPPAITSPGRVITLIWPHSSAHFGFLLLAMWMRRARLEL